MALANVKIQAPGFFGINTEDSSAQLEPAWAKQADNCVIDSRGRITSRKGTAYLTTVGGTGTKIKSIFEFLESDGTIIVFSTGNNKVYTGTTTLTNITGGLTITADDWEIVQLDDEVHFFQTGHEPLVWDEATAALTLHTAHAAAAGVPPHADAVCSGYGRLFAGGVATDGHIIYWTDLLIGTKWSGGTSGSLDLQKHWPTGYDKIVGLEIHNNFLIVFGRNSILVFKGVDTPSTMTLDDTIAGIGLHARDSVVHTGKDLFFLDSSGFRSLGRTIQEKSIPLGVVSRNVNSELRDTIGAESSPIKAVYDRKNANVLLMFPSTQITYVFDTKFPLENGSLRATVWPSLSLNCGFFQRDDTLLLGADDGIKTYLNYNDESSGTYVMRYYFWSQDFDQPVTEKFAKGMDFTIGGGSGYTIAIKYAWDHFEDYKTISKTIATLLEAEFGVAEFGDDEFGGSVVISRIHVTLGGSGRSISMGIEATIDGKELAIQEMNVHIVLGRII